MFGLKPLAWWVIPWGLLAGLLLTLAFLGSMDYAPAPGCWQAIGSPPVIRSLPRGCSALAEGYPVRFLSSVAEIDQEPGANGSPTASLFSEPFIDKSALAEDWLIWSLISCSALYLISPRKARPARSPLSIVQGGPAGESD